MINLEKIVERHVSMFHKQYEQASSYEERRSVINYYKSFLQTMLQDENKERKYWIDFIRLAHIAEPYNHDKVKPVEINK
jgi:hypothetical protein